MVSRRERLVGRTYGLVQVKITTIKSTSYLKHGRKVAHVDLMVEDLLRRLVGSNHSLYHSLSTAVHRGLDSVLAAAVVESVFWCSQGTSMLVRGRLASTHLHPRPVAERAPTRNNTMTPTCTQPA